MAEYLFGETNDGTSSIGVNSRAWARQFTATSDSTLNEIQIYCLASGDAKVAIYADSADSAGALIDENATGTACSSGQWNSISMPDVTITSGNKYWLTVHADTAGMISYLGTSGNAEWTDTYSYAEWGGIDPFVANYDVTTEIAIAAFGIGTALGTGDLNISGGGVDASSSRPVSVVTGSLSLSGGSVNAVYTVVADDVLGSGILSLSGGSVNVTNSWYSDLGAGNLNLGSNGIVAGDSYDSDLATGHLSLGAVGVNEIFTWDSALGTGNISLGASKIVTADPAIVDYNQSRTFASAAERMRSCVLADNFISAYKTRLIGGTVVGSPAYINSVTLDGLSYIVYGQQPLSNYLSAVVKFSTDSVSSGLLFGTVVPISASIDGWRIWVDSTGIRANHSDGTALGTQCGIDFDYADGETHTVTYAVDMVSGSHVLYVDTDEDSQLTTATGTIGTGRQIAVGGFGFVGTVGTARLFESNLSAGEHAVYYTNSLSSIFDNSIATYRCDSVSDHTDHIWTKTINMTDLTKGDGASSGYPTQVDGHYVFDGVDDYVSDWPTLPAQYTASAAFETTGYPYIQQVNDATIRDLLTIGGAFTGKLHNLVVTTGLLTDIEKKHLEYRQLFYTTRGYADAIENQLIVDGSCVLNHFYDSVDTVVDYSKTNASSVETDTTLDDGLTFPLTTSLVTVTDELALRLDAITICISGIGLDDIAATEYLVYKNGNYYLTVAPINASTFTIDLNGSTAILDRGEISHISVSAIHSLTPRFYVNGEYAADGGATVSLNDSTSNDLVIGNDAGGNNFSGTLERLHVYNTPLTDHEIRHLYNQSTRTAP